MPEKYEAILIVSFGGPEGPDDVIPFLENVLRGKNVPRERMLEVAQHYQHFGGVSPINQQNREFIAALKKELKLRGPDLPVYWGNRNWHPLLTDTLEQMKADGINKAIAYMTSAYSSYSGCRQYREDIIKACDAIGEGAPQIDKLRVFYNHPGFINAMTERVTDALSELDIKPSDRVRLVYTAHSLPNAMADKSNYAKQLGEASRLVSESVTSLGHAIAGWDLVYQSRSGPPSQPWLEPDVCDYIQRINDEESFDHMVIIPVGFVSDHMEVVYDLDTEAKELCEQLSISMVRAKTVGNHPVFISMVRDLINERIDGTEQIAIGSFPASHDVCPVDCCPSGRPAARAKT